MVPIYRLAVAASLAVGVSISAMPGAAMTVRADSPTISAGPLRTGWDASEPSLTPSAVTSGGFGQRFATALPDPVGDAHPGNQVVYAQPVTSHAVVIVATEKDRVFGIDENSGGILWADTIGTYEPDDRGCGQVTPYLGITSTPVVDQATGTVYVMARDFLGGSSAVWRLHALDVLDGGERAGWPVTVGGAAWNRPTLQFDGSLHQQRPALLLLNGSVFAGFGSFCDGGPYHGWIFGVSTTNAGVHSLYIDEPSGSQGALWASGGGFVADQPTSFLAATGNGTGAGDQPPMTANGKTISASNNLADSVVRFQIQGDGVTVWPSDFFGRAATDTNDSDLGSSQVSALPDQFSAPNHAHLAVVGGKFGTLYVLDRDNLGGRTVNDAGAVSAINNTQDLYGHVASWPGDGGFVYDAGSGSLNAFRLSGGSLTRINNAGAAFGSGSPLITSNGTANGSAMLWFYERGSGELRGYNANAAAGFTLLFHARVGNPNGATKFIDVAADQGRLLVASDDGFLHVFGIPGLPPVPCNCTPPTQGYWLVASDGGIFPFGLARSRSYGSTGNIRLNQPIVGMAPTASSNGYWLVASDGGIFPFGDAVLHSYGSTGNIRLNKPIVGMASTASGNGYWLVASDGGIFPFGDAMQHSYGSTGNIHLNQPIVGMARTASGNGYWLVASDGGIFPFGDAMQHSYGSTGNVRLNQPIVGMARTASGNGYWLVASDGGIFPFGDAVQHSYGSTGSVRLNRPIVGMASTADGNGYWLVAADGGIFPFGPSAGGWGSTGNIALNQPIVGMAGIG